MIRVATASEMQEMDRRTAVEFGIPSLLLMENAGAETVHEILAAFPGIGGLRVLVLCGQGNNGGDGFVVARRLRAVGARVDVFLLGRRGEVRGDAAGALRRYSGRVTEITAVDVGHCLIARAVLTGMSDAVWEIRQILQGGPTR